MAAGCSPTTSTPTDSPSSTPRTSISASSVLDSSGSQDPDGDDKSRQNSNRVLRKLITPLELLTRVHNSIRLVFFLLFLLVQDTIAYRVSGSRSASREHRRNSSTGSTGAFCSSSSSAAAETDPAGWHWIAGRRHRAKREIVGALTWTFGWLPIVVLGLALLLGLWMAEWVSGVAAMALAAGVKVLSRTG